MPKNSPRARAVDLHLLALLTEVARHLVAAGVKSPKFTSMARMAFFTASLEVSKFGNDKLNQSAVAAMTGLTRHQVRQFAKQSLLQSPVRRDRTEIVIEGWLTDGRFTSARGEPKVLRIGGRDDSFESLVRKYGGDIPHRALLREFQRHKLVTVRNSSVMLRQAARESPAAQRLGRLAKALVELLRESPNSPQYSTTLRTLNNEVYYPATSERGRVLLHQRMIEGLNAFLARVQAAGMAASVEAPQNTKRKAKVTRTRVMLITEDLG